jgi:hypothetical protein
VHVLQALQDLIDDILLVDVFEDVGSDDGVEVSVHEVEHQVDVSVIFRPDHILKTNDVLVSGEFLKENDLSEGALGIGGVLERVKVLLECYDFLGTLVNRLPYNTISTLTCSDKTESSEEGIAEIEI